MLRSRKYLLISEPVRPPPVSPRMSQIACRFASSSLGNAVATSLSSSSRDLSGYGIPFMHFVQEHAADSCLPSLPTWVIVDHDNDTMPLCKCGRVPLTEERPQDFSASRRTEPNPASFRVACLTYTSSSRETLALRGVRLAMGCDSPNLPAHVGFVFEWIQEIYPELVKIAHVAGHDRQPMHQGRRGDHGVLQHGV